MYTLYRLVAVCVSPLEKDVYSGSLSIFWLDYLFYCCWLYEFCICFEYQPWIWYILCKYFSIPVLGRSPTGGSGNLLQYSWLGNPTDRGAWQAMAHSLQGVIHNWATEHGSTCGMQDLNSPIRTEHRPWPWKCQVLITELPGNSLDDLLLTRAVSLHTEHLAMSGDNVHL